MADAWAGDVRGLERELRATVDGEVRFDDGSRALYATDGSNYRQVPIGVVLPRTIEAVVATVAVCRKYQAPLLPRGCGTSLAGQSCNVAVVVDTSKYLRKIHAIDTERRVAVVEPGVVLDQLRQAAYEVGLTFAPDPSTHVSNTIGGMLGNNSCGVHSVMGGRTSDNVESLEILTYEGDRFTVGPTSDEEYNQILAAGGRRAEIYRKLRDLARENADLIRSRYPDIPRRVSGYNLLDLLPENGFHLARALVGSEGTCVVILSATVRLLPSPRRRVLTVIGFPDIFSAADEVPKLMALHPIGLEAIDEGLAKHMRELRVHEAELDRMPQGKAWLLVEFGGEDEQAPLKPAMEAVRLLGRSPQDGTVRIESDPAQQMEVWAVRESGLSVTARSAEGKESWEGWEDAAVPPAALGSYLREFAQLLKRFDYETAMYGHFGQGCVHCRINFDFTSRPGIEKFEKFIESAADLVVAKGGSLSGEHGDGQSRARLLERMYGPELVDAFREFKRIFDPLGRMNPGKKVDAAAPTDHLRIWETYRPRRWSTYFAYPEDHGDFNQTTLRCVGIGKCRKLVSGGVMCPSFMATEEEKFTTRGRARLLYEMAQNGALRGGWSNTAVRESLDLCLSCKGCKKECPVQVDMATYKAEFLAHHYRYRLRPRAAYALGLSYRWLPMGSRVPGLVNSVAQWPPTGRLLRRMGGIARERPMPRLAARSYLALRRARPSLPPVAPRGRSVVLWPDTWNNYLHPHVLAAAERALVAMGFHVEVPRRALCCGRPLYDFGMLRRAKGLLAQILRAVPPTPPDADPIVVLEPSCLSIFRDELPNLFPGDAHATALSRRAMSLAELVEHERIELPALRQKLVLQPHCHEASILGTDATAHLLARLRADAHILNSGCCGMAGSFGMEAAKYPVSLRIAERGVIGSVKARDPAARVVADGFSCREQIRDLAHVEAVTTAELVAMAFDAGATAAP